jgi:hypothetical protein
MIVYGVPKGENTLVVSRKQLAFGVRITTPAHSAGPESHPKPFEIIIGAR